MDNSPTFRPLDQAYCDVVSLPFEVGSGSGSSNLIERINKKKENEHVTAVEQMKQQFKKVNQKIGEEIWQESRILKSFLVKMKGGIEEMLNTTIRNYEDEIAELKEEIFEETRTKIKQYEQDCLGKIDCFYQTLKDIEKKRSDSFKTILNESYRKLQKISFKFPNELLEFFETEILKINEITLDNHRHYLHLYADLKLQTENHVKTLLLEMQEVEDKYKVAVKKVCIRDLVDLKFINFQNIFDLESVEGEEDVQIVAKISATFASVPSVDNNLTINTTDIGAWSKHIQETLEILDNNARKLVDLYKMAVVNIFNRFFHELQKVTDLLLEEESSELIKDLYVQSEVFKPVIEDLTQQYTCEVADLQKLWNSITEYMQSNIKNTYKFLDGSSHLWDAHFNRMNECRSLILQDLKTTIQKNDKTSQDFEKKINKTIDMLRQAPTVSKLDQYLAEANKFLDATGDLLSKQCEQEIKTLEKYHKLMNQEIEVLVSEIDRFLAEFADEKVRYSKSYRKSGGETSIVDPDLKENLIPHQMKSCRYQVDAVNNWMLGLWEAVRMYMTTCRKELTEQTALWVKNQASKLKKRLEVRMAIHKPRYARIKHAVYDVRLKEIENHLKIVEKIDKAMEEHITSSSFYIQECRQKQNCVIEEYKKELSEIEEKAKVAKKSFQIMSYIERANTSTRKTKQALEDNFQANDKEIEENLKKVKCMVVEAGDSMILVSDGGRYSHEEAKIFIKNLGKINKTLPKKYAKIVEKAETMKMEVLEEFKRAQSDIVVRLERSKKEFQHNEEAILKIRKLRNDIHRKVHSVKYKLMRINASIEYFATLSKINLWKRKNFELMKKALIDCLEKMSDLTAYLIWRDENDTTVLPPTYTAEIEELIQTSYEDIRQMAEVFYREHGAIVNEGKIQSCYEAFMEEVSRNYDQYKKQVKINSLELAEELIGYILKLLKINDGVYEALVSNRTAKEEEYKELYRKLCEVCSSLEMEKKSLEQEENEERVKEETEKQSLVKEERGESVEEEKDPNVVDLVQENRARVNILHTLIKKLFNHVKEKIIVMQNTNKIL